MANNHIHFNAGKDHYPQVIAVSSTASLCLTICTHVQLCNKCSGPTLCSLQAQATGGQLPLHLGSGLARASLDAEGKIHPEILLTLIYYYYQCIYLDIFYDEVLHSTVFWLDFCKHLRQFLPILLLKVGAKTTKTEFKRSPFLFDSKGQKHKG